MCRLNELHRVRKKFFCAVQRDMLRSDGSAPIHSHVCGAQLVGHAQLLKRPPSVALHHDSRASLPQVRRLLQNHARNAHLVHSASQALSNFQAARKVQLQEKQGTSRVTKPCNQVITNVTPAAETTTVILCARKQ